MKKFGEMPVEVAKGLQKAVEKSGFYIIQIARTEIDGTRKKGGYFRGNLWRSMQKPRIRPLEVEVGPTVKYAIYVHRGTKPHWVSARHLAPWAKAKGLNVYALQKSIAKKGTKANPFMDRTAKRAEKGVQRIFDEEIDKIISK